jgi:hypothetical protein
VQTRFEHIRRQYHDQACRRAAIDPALWNPALGFQANRLMLHNLYYYYQKVYFENPACFLWAGLARLTGGQVLYGLGNAVKIARDPCVLTQEIVAVARDIFENLAWQHEAFLDDPDLLVSVWQERERRQLNGHRHSYAASWKLVGSADYATVCTGNEMLFENEQRDTIQPHYETIRRDPYANRYFRFTRLVMRQIHPHHRRFIFDLPWGDVTRFPDRWRWISHPTGMWPAWTGLKQSERDRLVGLSNEAVIGHRW